MLSIGSIVGWLSLSLVIRLVIPIVVSCVRLTTGGFYTVGTVGNVKLHVRHFLINLVKGFIVGQCDVLKELDV
jgi:hypothetical protein